MLLGWDDRKLLQESEKFQSDLDMRQLMSCLCWYFKSNEENRERCQSAQVLELRVSSERGKRSIYSDVATQRKSKFMVSPGNLMLQASA